MTSGADDEGLAPHLGHEGCPHGLARSGLAEAGEVGDVVPQDNGCFHALEWRDDRWVVLSVNELPDST